MVNRSPFVAEPLAFLVILISSHFRERSASIRSCVDGDDDGVKSLAPCGVHHLLPMGPTSEKPFPDQQITKLTGHTGNILSHVVLEQPFIIHALTKIHPFLFTQGPSTL